MILGICPKEFIPPREGGGIIPNEVHVVEIMVPSARIKRNQVQRVERNIITAVHIDGFQQTYGHPCPQENYVITQKHNSDEKSCPKNQGFQGMCVFCFDSKWSLKLVMDFMNVFINSLVVKESVQEIMPGVLNDCTAQTPCQS